MLRWQLRDLHENVCGGSLFLFLKKLTGKMERVQGHLSRGFSDTINSENKK
jgi:hypothetical protein